MKVETRGTNFIARFFYGFYEVIISKNRYRLIDYILFSIVIDKVTVNKFI